jgi:hypothetical protein
MWQLLLSACLDFYNSGCTSSWTKRMYWYNHPYTQTNANFTQNHISLTVVYPGFFLWVAQQIHLRTEGRENEALGGGGGGG